MHRLHSTTGCFRCKLRRKKCDEKRPICSGCARWAQWRDSCSYVTPLPTSQSASTVLLKLSKEVPKDAHENLPVRRLGVVRHRGDEMETKVLQIIPGLLTGFFSPVSADRIRDLQTMWQLMMNNQILRNACVACFSRFLDDSMVLVRLSQESYGRTLQALRSKILQVNLDPETAISVIIAMVFLGKLESFAPRSNADTLEHWGPLIPLLASEQIEKLTKNRILPMNEKMLVFEALLYHVGTHAIFSRTTERVWNLWRTHNIYGRICAHNPDGPDRIKRSPALSGQYTFYHMAFYLTYLLRRHSQSHCPLSLADELEVIIYQHNARLDRDFAVMSATRNAVKYEAECAVYHFFCNSLLICITALREPSQSQRIQMKQFADLGMNMFLDLPVYGDVPDLAEHAGHFILTAIWAIEVQCCALYTVEQYEIFMDHYAMFERYLDPGHQIRARWLFDQVYMLLQKVSAEGKICTSTEVEDPAIPVGLALLRSVVTMPEPAQKTITL